MVKKLCALALAIVLAVSVMIFPVAAGAAGFSDVSDRNTATAIETLRLMGVLDGYGDGTFRPEQQLTRAQFCKMAAYIMHAEQELERYRTTTIFPDVKPSHWAAAYVNLAAKGKNIIAGYPDGKFYPERTVTVGQAVTILLRLLGYKDEEVGGVWPDSYMAVGAMSGLTNGVGTNGNAPLNRGQAARLFLNLLQTEKKDGGTLYELSQETELLAVDGATGTMKTADGKSYQMVRPVMSTTLAGRQGKVVLSGGKALTFLPTTGTAGGRADAAVIIYEDRSAAGLDALAGNSNYQIYKNGLPASVGDLRRNDVATYNAATNSILVCDTRVLVYYESCEPNPDEPVKIRVLGGTELHVLPTAMDSMSAFKPGQQMILLLTADGQVAAAQDPANSGRSNALGIVSDQGTVRMLCGTAEIELKLDGTTVDESCYGKVVRISAGKKNEVNLTVQQNNLSGDLNVTERTLGKKQLAETAMVYDGGTLIGLNQLTTGIVREAQILYARTNWKDQVDLIALDTGNGRNVYYGRATVTEREEEDGFGTLLVRELEVAYYKDGAAASSGKHPVGVAVKNNDYIVAKLNPETNRFVSVEALTKLGNVPKRAWVGKTTVSYGGWTYAVAENVSCYNLDSEEWVDLDRALNYANTMNLYMKDGVVRVVEVKH